jgi:hypothetical protein
MLARSMKQKRYSSATVGTMYKSILSRRRASAFGSKVTRALPYLESRESPSRFIQLEGYCTPVSRRMSYTTPTLARPFKRKYQEAVAHLAQRLRAQSPSKAHYAAPDPSLPRHQNPSRLYFVKRRSSPEREMSSNLLREAGVNHLMPLSSIDSAKEPIR